MKPFLEKILELEDPWSVREITLDQERARIDTYLDFRRGGAFPCPCCGTVGCKVHDSAEKTWRHLDLFQYRAYLHARLPRVDCPDHGIHTAKVPWAREFTLLFEAFAMSLIRFMPAASVARILDEWDTRIWRIAHHHVDKAVAEQDLSHVTAVGVDETARKRGHNYISAFVELKRKGDVFVTEGKGKPENLTKAQKETLDSLTGSRANLKVARAEADQTGLAAGLLSQQSLVRLLPGQMVLVGQSQPPCSDNEVRENGQKAQGGHLERHQDQKHQRHSGGPEQPFQGSGSKGERL